ncbi:hypothetical protein Emag_000403 [Eimeria magna]
MDYAEEALDAPLSGGGPLSGGSPQEEQRGARRAYPSEGRTSAQNGVGASQALLTSSASEPGSVGALSVGPSGLPQTSSPVVPGLHPEGGGHSRSCFICLEGPRRGRRGGAPKLLHPCCSQCYAVVHEKCWTAYRRRQRLATFRARLLGHRAPDVAKCSICRTDHGSFAPPQPIGEGASALQEQLLATLGRLLMDDGEVSGQPTCSGLASLHHFHEPLIPPALCACSEALASLPPAPAPPSGEGTPPDPRDPPQQGAPSPRGSDSAPTEEGGSTSSRPRGSGQDSAGAASSGSQRGQGEAAGNLSAAQQQGLQSRWLSFFRRGGLASAGAMATTAAMASADPFLADAALVVEMQVLHSGPVHS